MDRITNYDLVYHKSHILFTKLLIIDEEISYMLRLIKNSSHYCDYTRLRIIHITFSFVFLYTFSSTYQRSFFNVYMYVYKNGKMEKDSR